MLPYTVCSACIRITTINRYICFLLYTSTCIYMRENYSFVRAVRAVKKNKLGHSTSNSKFNCVEPLFPNSVTRWRARKLLPLCHTAVSAPKVLLQGGRFWDQQLYSWSCGRITEHPTGKKTEIEVLADVDLIADSAKKKGFFCGRCNTGGHVTSILICAS